MKTILRYGLAALAIAGLITASPVLAAGKPSTSAQVVINDSANLFSASAIDKAKNIISSAMGEGNRQVHIETYKELSASERKELEATGADKAEFWKKWAQGKAKGDEGIVILVNRSPGHVKVLADKKMREHGISSDKVTKIEDMLYTGFHEAKKPKEDGMPKSESEQMTVRDSALISVADYIKAALPTSTITPHTNNKKTASTASTSPASPEDDQQHSSIGKWICIGLCVLVGVWLVFGLIRAFTGGGGGGGGGMGGGGGGGGGGFMSGLMGGLFGSMAGMWLYNNMFGGHESSAYGGDTGGGDMGGSESAGGGDFSGDDGAGRDFDGDSGGGDAGGGGGDWGGGGDVGGGGGDWGGGGGDF